MAAGIFALDVVSTSGTLIADGLSFGGAAGSGGADGAGAERAAAVGEGTEGAVVGATAAD